MSVDVVALRALLGKAAETPWEVSEVWEDEYADDKAWRRINSQSDVSVEAAIADLGDWNQDGNANAALICAAVNALPELLAIAEAAIRAADDPDGDEQERLAWVLDAVNATRPT